MATINNRKTKNGTVYDVHFYLSKTKRKKIFGFSVRREAERFGEKLDRLVELQRIGENDKDVTRWLAALASSDPKHYDKIVSFGLAEKRIVAGALGELVKKFITEENLKSRTLRNRKMVTKRLIKFFGAGKSVRTFSVEDAVNFDSEMKSTLSLATWGRDVKTVKQLFALAVEIGWATENPFRKLKGSSVSNPKRQYNVTLKESEKILDACKDSQERLIFSLARFGGLRIPSELEFMEWSDVDLTGNRFIVKIPKKTGKRAQERKEFTTRAVPMFPELRKAFSEYYEDLPEGCPDRMFSVKLTNGALRSRFVKILKRAGVPMWEKFFQNMRSTRETELVEKYSIHVVTSWIGNTPAVAQKHYLQVRDEDFTIASSAGQKEEKEKSCVSIGRKVDNLTLSDDEKKELLELINTYSKDPENLSEKVGRIIGLYRHENHVI